MEIISFRHSRVVKLPQAALQIQTIAWKESSTRLRSWNWAGVEKPAYE